jgi:beta-xylosidase
VGKHRALQGLKEVQDIRIRDPFIYPDAKAGTYYRYAQSGNRRHSNFLGVEAYTSKDLIHWQDPQPVLTLPEDAGIQSVWAPEVHEYGGRFYLFVTLTFKRPITNQKPVESADWPDLHERGTYIYSAGTPAGPFHPLKGASHTPPGWMALDGTLFVEDDTPYMVFCHEWVQQIDGTINVVQLKDDLSGTIGTPAVLFKASDAPGASSAPGEGKITDGCFLYRSAKSGRLFMIWSTFIPGRDYCVVLSRSQSGKINGPWADHKLIYAKNGGHGMIFESFGGQLLMALHQPNTEGAERLRLYRVTDSGDILRIGEGLG